jgi:hypothetical protein
MPYELEKIAEDVYAVAQNGKFKTGLSWKESMNLATKMSAKKKSFRLLTLQEAYDLTHKDENFKNEIMKPYWIWNLEQFNKADVKESSAIGELIRLGKFKEPKEKVWKGGIYYENGKSSVRSGWNTLGGLLCFYAIASVPAVKSRRGLAVFKLVKK